MEMDLLALNTIPDLSKRCTCGDIVVTSPHSKDASSDTGEADVVDGTDSRVVKDRYRSDDL